MMIKRISYVLLLTFFPVFLSRADAPSDDSYKTFESSENINVLGDQYLLLTTAVTVFLEHGLKLSDYMIALRKLEDGYAVIFTDPELTIFQIGSTKRMRTFEVILDSAGRVVQATFVR